MGFQSMHVDMSIAAATTHYGLPTPEILMSLARKKMADAMDTHRIEHVHYKSAIA